MPVLAALAETEPGKRADVEARRDVVPGGGQRQLPSLGWSRAIWMVANCSPRQFPPTSLAAGTFSSPAAATI
jgi:hypothetical protein